MKKLVLLSLVFVSVMLMDTIEASAQSNCVTIAENNCPGSPGLRIEFWYTYSPTLCENSSALDGANILNNNKYCFSLGPNPPQICDFWFRIYTCDESEYWEFPIATVPGSWQDSNGRWYYSLYNNGLIITVGP